MENYKRLRGAAYVCQRLALFGVLLWIANSVIFFVQYFSEGMRLPDFRAVVAGYGGTLISAIVPILLLYAAGGAINLLLTIEQNTRNTTSS